MRNQVWIIYFACLTSTAFSQEKSFTVFDTILLEEITITETVPLDNRAVLDLYQSSRFSSIDKINSRLEGISLIRRGAYAMEPQMHGFSGGQINITIDGMKMFGACTDKMDPVTSYIEPDNLESLKITHGTSGNRHGSAVGGSFDMLLKGPETSPDHGFSIVAGTGYETVSQGINANGALEINREKWAFRSSATYRKHASYTDGNGELVPNSQYEKINLHSVLKVEFDHDNILRMDFLLDDAFDVGYPALPMDVGRAKARIYSLQYEKYPGEGMVQHFKAKLYYNSVFHLMDDSRRDSTFFLDDEPGGSMDTVYMRMDMPGWSDTWGGFLETEIALNDKNHLYLKVDDYLNFSRANMTMYMNQPGYPGEPPMYAETWPDMYRNVVGVFARNTSNLNQSLNLILDARIENSISRVTSETGWRQFSIFGYDINRPYVEFPKSVNMNLNYRKGRFGVDGGLGYAERLPTNSEQFGFFLYNALDGYDYLGNPDLRMESSRHIRANLHYSQPAFKVTLRNQFSKVKNYILGRIDPDIPPMNLYASGLKRYQNISHAFLYGASLQLQWIPVEDLKLYSLFKYTFARTHEGEPLPLIPPFKNMSICRYQKKSFSVQAEGEFSSAQYRISPTFGETPTDAFAIFHLRASWSLALSKYLLEMSSGVENIFDKAYSEHLDWGQYLRPGRNFYIHLSLRI
jgi:iron complex outermembrane receptor protein